MKCKNKLIVVTNEQMLRDATATPLPCLLPIWIAWLAGRLQTHGLIIREEDGSCDAPYAAWLQSKLAVYDAKVRGKLAKALDYVDLRMPVLERELEQQGLPTGDEVAARRARARRTALEKEKAELLALSAKAAELAAARHAQIAARIPPRVKAFVQGASHRQPLDQAAVTARLCAAYDRSV